MDALNIIYKNTPLKQEYDEDHSFIARLCEYGIWDMNAYFQLESAIYFISENRIKNEDLFKIFFNMQFKITTVMLSHFIKHDIIKITNLNSEQIIEYHSRVTSIIRGYVMDVIPKIEDLDGDLINPYLR